MKKLTKIDYVTDPATKPNKSGNGTHQIVEVTYTQDDNQNQMVLRSWANPTVFQQVQELVGKTVMIDVVKNKAGYWNWASIETDYNESEATPPKSTDSGGTQNRGGRVTGSNYESPQERGRRQLFTSRAAAMKMVLDKHEKLPHTVKQWEDAKKAAFEVVGFVMDGYELNEDDTVRRVQDETPE